MHVLDTDRKSLSARIANNIFRLFISLVDSFHMPHQSTLGYESRRALGTNFAPLFQVNSVHMQFQIPFRYIAFLTLFTGEPVKSKLKLYTS